MRRPALLLTVTLALAACGDRSGSPSASPASEGPAAHAPRAPSAPGDPMASTAAPPPSSQPAPGSTPPAPPPRRDLATFAAGCFWCVEAVFEQVPGVLEAVSGYMGGTTRNPTYEEVCTGATGHAEVVHVSFDPSKVGYETLLSWFWRLHDPTTLNQQGADVGTQYRSAIFWHSDAQREAAERSKAAADASGAFRAPIVTEIAKAGAFWPAEGYHQGYYRENRAAGYCRVVIAPKLEHLGLEK